MQQQQVQMTAQPGMQPGMQQQVVVQGQQPSQVEPEQKCCVCIEIPCGATILMIIEIIYQVVFIIFLVGVFFLGAVAKGAVDISDSSY